MGTYFSYLLETYIMDAIDANAKDSELGGGPKGINAHAWRFPL